MAPMAVPVPGVASTPPSSRSNTPNTRPSLKQYANSILPFTRQSGSGKFTPLPCPDEVSTSYKEEGIRQPNFSTYTRAAEAPDLSDTVGSWVSWKRVPPRAASSFTAVPFNRQQGFSAPSPEVLEGQRPAGVGLGPQQGLLSRQLSSECLAPRPQFPDAGVSSSRDDAVRKLNQAFQGPSAFESSEYDDDLNDGDDILEELQGRYSVFKHPTVVQAFKLALSTRNTVQVPSNAPSELRHWDAEEQRAVLGNCCQVATILAELGADETVVASALLHNVLQCSMMTETRLREFVPLEVASIVKNVSRMSGICEVRREVLEARGGINDPKLAQDFTSVLLAMADVKAVLVKLADRLDNLRTTPVGQSLEVAAREALDIFGPLANRLGVWSIKAEMEDLAFQALYPLEHDELKAKLRESQARGSLEKALDTLKGVLDKQGPSFLDLSGRPKNLYGVFKKMKEKEQKVDDVLDVRAMRVIVKSKTDCYEVLRQVHKLWKPVPDRTKDYIRRPKENGYQSLHTVVMGDDGLPMEIQIRTDKMHFIAEYGVAAHWRYKESLPSNHYEDQQVAWARWLITWKLELEDKKCRPRGSPGNDLSLAELANKICKFPEHSSDCKFAAYLRKRQFAPQDSSSEAFPEVPAQVIILDHTTNQKDAPLRIQQVAQHTTAEELFYQIRASLPYPDDLILLVNHAEPVPSQILVSGDQVEIASISGLQRAAAGTACLDHSGDSADMNVISEGGRRSNLVRRPGRPPRPSSDFVRTHDSIGSAEVEAKRAELIKAFHQQDGNGDAVVGPRTPDQNRNVPLIYSYGFVEGQPELN